MKIGGLILTENELIVTRKKGVKPRRPRSRASFDVNLTNVTALVDEEMARYDLEPLCHIHGVYEEERRKIQRLSKRKPKTGRRLTEKYSRRERNRAKDFMHKLTTEIAEELSEMESGAILEDLKNVKSRVLRRSKDLSRKQHGYPWGQVDGM